MYTKPVLMTLTENLLVPVVQDGRMGQNCVEENILRQGIHISVLRIWMSDSMFVSIMS
jgi:hypothetical protein